MDLDQSSSSIPEKFTESVALPIPKILRKSISESEKLEIELFQEFLRLETNHPKPQYLECAAWLRKQALKFGDKCTYKEISLVQNKPFSILTLKGTDSTLPSVIFNCHTDVVPYYTEKWTRAPMDASIDKNGNIWGRGTQDMKVSGAQYLCALERIWKKDPKWTPKRTIHFTYAPDEEIGGHDGWELLVDDPQFLYFGPVACIIDEGIASPNSDILCFYGERAAWWIRIKVTGPAGHGSRFIQDPANETLVKICQKLLTFRAAEHQRLIKSGKCHHDHESNNQPSNSEPTPKNSVNGCSKRSPALALGDVTTLNLTALKSGVSFDNGKTFSINVVPMEAEACFDIRIPPTVNLDSFRTVLDSWILSEKGASYTFVQHRDKNPLTPIHIENPHTLETQKNPWFQILEKSTQKFGKKLVSRIFPAATDTRYLRSIGIPAFGFSPISHTTVRMHAAMEYLNQHIYLEGIGIWSDIIKSFGEEDLNFLDDSAQKRVLKQKSAHTVQN